MTIIFFKKEKRVFEAEGVKWTRSWVKGTGRVWPEMALGGINSKFLNLKRGCRARNLLRYKM